MWIFCLNGKTFPSIRYMFAEFWCPIQSDSFRRCCRRLSTPIAIRSSSTVLVCCILKLKIVKWLWKQNKRFLLFFYLSFSGNIDVKKKKKHYEEENTKRDKERWQSVQLWPCVYEYSYMMCFHVGVFLEEHNKETTGNQSFWHRLVFT